MPKTAKQEITELEKELDSLNDKVRDLQWEVKSLQEKAKAVEAHIEKLTGETIHRIEFDPIKSLVYGMVGIVLTGVVTAILALVIKQ